MAISAFGGTVEATCVEILETRTISSRVFVPKIQSCPTSSPIRDPPNARGLEHHLFALVGRLLFVAPSPTRTGCMRFCLIGDHLGARVGHVAGGPDAGHAGQPGAIDEREAGLQLAAQTEQQAVVVGTVAGADEHCSPCDHQTIGQFDPGQPVVLDHQPCDATEYDLDTPGLQLAQFANY